jgi:flagellar basal-body rod protein FlgG
MMRSLWTAASGMSSQMLQIDNISHNLSNVNTTAFKRGRIEFKTLLYETMQRADMDPVNMTGRPVNLQVGHGVRPAAMTRMFTQGALQRTDRTLDFAIEGDGFF